MSKLAVSAFQKNVTTAGTAVALSATTLWAGKAKIKAKASNTGAVYLGALGGTSATTGYELSPGDSFDLPVPDDGRVDLSQIGLDSAVNGEGVCVTYTTVTP